MDNSAWWSFTQTMPIHQIYILGVLGFTSRHIRVKIPYPLYRVPAEQDISGQTLHWQYPETPEQARSMAVFQDLWERGMYVAGGSNYGADYVVYDGE